MSSCVGIVLFWMVVDDVIVFNIVLWWKMLNVRCEYEYEMKCVWRFVEGVRVI